MQLWAVLGTICQLRGACRDDGERGYAEIEIKRIQMKQLKSIPYWLIIAVVLGFTVYVVKAWNYANSLPSIGDEGAYLYKGYMFARGDYYPFQEYAFQTNKAPLSFLIPGYIQLWFGPGLREGRYFAMFISIAALIGIWITAHRLGGKGWSTLAIWVFALSDAHILFLARAVSQGLIACMMAWMFVLTLGENRSLWQLVFGSALSVMIVMTRQNMALVPALLVTYIFWQHGRIAGWWSLMVSAALFIGFHAYYWPNILQLWAPWLPRSLTPFLDYFRSPSSAGANSNSVPGFSSVQSLVAGMQNYFFITCGSIGALILWGSKDSWKSNSRFKMAVFLGVMFFSLFLMHAWASLLTQYCIWCFSGYQVFYNTSGFFFILIVIINGFNDSKPRQYILFFFLLFAAAGLGVHYHREWGGWFLDHIQSPRVSDGNFSMVSLKNILTYRFELSTEIQGRIASAVGGVAMGSMLIVFAWMIYRFKSSLVGGTSLAGLVLGCFLAVGTIFPVLSVDNGKNMCSTNYLSYYEEAGMSLSALVPSNSLVYWRGSGNHMALMLYVDDVRIFPAQIHAGGGDTSGTGGDELSIPRIEYLLRVGRFNYELDRQWRERADFFIIWDQFMTKEIQDFFSRPGYKVVSFDMGGLSMCEDPLLVFEKHQ